MFFLVLIGDKIGRLGPSEDDDDDGDDVELRCSSTFHSDLFSGVFDSLRSQPSFYGCAKHGEPGG